MCDLQARGTAAAGSHILSGSYLHTLRPSGYSPDLLSHRLGCIAHGLSAYATGSIMSSGPNRSQRPEAPRQTPSHVFEDKDRIGKGGSCDVYSGVQKGSGQRHALKVLREPSASQHNQLLQEAETLSRLACPKIVRFIAQNYEMETGLPVVVLENCEGGSLLSFLLQPENASGLDDDSFRDLLSDLVEGLSYLRSKGVVHRDIKPGNILRHVHTSGKIEYKLSDFGTSREASDTEAMTSIVGTEEYLHPVLYRNAFLGGVATPCAISPISGELWSLGCTLYHAITASVPFRPLGGRNNRKGMMFMTSQKPPGAISGEQRMDGSLAWSLTLPSGCRMSESLRDKVLPVLQNLMETNPALQWSFSTFVSESQRILRLISFHICDTECGHIFQLYMEPTQSLAEMHDVLALYTELPASQQLLFHRVQPLLAVGARALVRDLMVVTRPDQPLLLISATGHEGRCWRPAQEEPSMMAAEASLEDDIASSFRLCANLFLISGLVTTVYRLPTFLFSAILALRTALTSTMSTVETRFRVMSATCQERQSRLAMLTQITETLQSAAPSEQHTKLAQARQLCDQLRDSLWQLKYRLDESRRSADTLNVDNTLCHVFMRDDSCSALSHSFTKARDTWTEIQGRREKIPLSQLEQEKHKADKLMLNKLCTESVQRKKHVLSKRANLLEQYSSQVRLLCERLRAAQEVEHSLLLLKEDNEKFSLILNQVWACQSEDLSKLAADKSQHSYPPSASSPTLGSPRPICDQLEELLCEGLPDLHTFHIDSAHAAETHQQL